MRISFEQFQELRESMYSMVDAVPHGTKLYAALTVALDELDHVGYEMGYLDGETNEYIESDLR